MRWFWQKKKEEGAEEPVLQEDAERPADSVEVTSEMEALREPAPSGGEPPAEESPVEQPSPEESPAIDEPSALPYEPVWPTAAGPSHAAGPNAPEGDATEQHPAISNEPLWHPGETRMFGQPLPPEPPPPEPVAQAVIDAPVDPLAAGTPLVPDGELMEPMPPSMREWIGKHPMAVAVAALVLVTLAGSVVYAAVTTGPKEPPAAENGADGASSTSTITPGLTASPNATAQIDPSQAATAQASSPATGLAGLVAGAKADLIAYRKDGWIWVARENGEMQTKIIQQSSGAFSLSPDGKTLASIDGSGLLLTLTDTATRTSKKAGRAQADKPSWAPDSSWLVYVEKASAEFRIRKVLRDGTGQKDLAEGRKPKVARDGSLIAYLKGAASQQAGTLYTLKEGKTPKQIAAKVTDFAFGPDRLFYAQNELGQGGAGIRSVKLDGSGRSDVKGAPSKTNTVYSRLMLSSDGSWLAFTESGDDGASRMFTIRKDGTKLKPTSERWDEYPVCWSVNGSTVFFIRGNAEQGEKTQLRKIQADGSLLELVVDKAMF